MLNQECRQCGGTGVVTLYHGMEKEWIADCYLCGGRQLRTPSPRIWTREYSPWPKEVTA